MNRFPKLFIQAMAAAFLAASTTATAELLLKPNDFIAAGGDSITEIHRYTVFMEDYLLMCGPVENLRLAQFGWGGTSANHFLGRLDADVLPWHPNVVTLCFGMNDGRFPDGRAKALTPAVGDRYRQNITAIAEKLKAGGVRTVVIGSPGVVDSYYYGKLTPPSDPATPIDVTYNRTLAGLGEIAREVAGKEQAVFADVHGVMAEVMPKAKAAYGEKYVFAGADGIHPKAAGSLVMAYAFLKGLGFDGAIGTITVDLAANKAEGTPGQKIISMKDGSVQIESTRYPFCFYGDPAQSDDVEATSGIIRFFPFNEDLNRYLLIVKGLAAPRAKVTWGAASREFSSAELARGINLAAAFVTGNPFSEKFAEVDRAVQRQQVQDLNLLKGFLPNAASFKRMVSPGKEGMVDALAAAGKEHELKLFQDAATLVTPVQHTIRIEPVR